ncbi:hypothetical protein [Actinosynnema sp. NPDC023587]
MRFRILGGFAAVMAGTLLIKLTRRGLRRREDRRTTGSAPLRSVA